MVDIAKEVAYIKELYQKNIEKLQRSVFWLEDIDIQDLTENQAVREIQQWDEYNEDLSNLIEKLEINLQMVEDMLSSVE